MTAVSFFEDSIVVPAGAAPASSKLALAASIRSPFKPKWSSASVDRLAYIAPLGIFSRPETTAASSHSQFSRKPRG